jgi:hypothetical protein
MLGITDGKQPALTFVKKQLEQRILRTLLS